MSPLDPLKKNLEKGKRSLQYFKRTWNRAGKLVLVPDQPVCRSDPVELFKPAGFHRFFADFFINFWTSIESILTVSIDFHGPNDQQI